jgi:hypothetical protein
MGAKERNQKQNIVNDAIIKDIRDAVSNLDYGIVTIKVHESKIVQFEVTQRTRFDDVWKLEEGGGI